MLCIDHKILLSEEIFVIFECYIVSYLQQDNYQGLFQVLAKRGIHAHTQTSTHTYIQTHTYMHKYTHKQKQPCTHIHTT